MQYLKNSQLLKTYRRKLRRDETSAEQILWQGLRNRRLVNKRFCRQFSVGPYILDFYCPEYRIGIELDGDIHLLESVQKNDREKSEYLTFLGVRLLRFTNDQVFANGKFVLEEIARVISEVDQGRSS